MALVADVDDPLHVNSTPDLVSRQCTEDATNRNHDTAMPKVLCRFDWPLEVLDLIEEGWESWEFVYKQEDVLHMTLASATFHDELSARRMDTDTDMDKDSDSDQDGRPHV